MAIENAVDQFGDFKNELLSTIRKNIEDAQSELDKPVYKQAVTGRHPLLEGQLQKIEGLKKLLADIEAIFTRNGV